ncbi:MAG TPA: helix-turn-helix domain-containing protein [Candidatus Limnocylindria bacterium]|nr:helix-turn-helix domain-containing protein [Candidatus Limnocylindria bacterium]
MSTKAAVEQGADVPRSTKVRILEAAEQVFAERGFEGASTREIAARADVNISSLHYHWASKETLYVAVFRNVFARIMDHLESSITPLLERAAPRAESPEMVDRVMRELFDFFAARPTIPRLLLRRIVESEDRDHGLERDVLGPAWEHFTAWTRQAKLDDASARLFMLTMHSVVMVYALDSAPYCTVLGGSVQDPRLADALRTHVAELACALLERMAAR